MVYLYIKKRGSNNYYYLRKNIRDGKKTMTKDIKYLGKQFNISELKDVSPTARKKIIRIKLVLEIPRKKRMVENKFLTKEQMIEVEAILTHHKTQRKNKDRLIKKFNAKFIYESAESLEKNINRKEIDKILVSEITPKNKSIILANKIIGLNNALIKLQKKKPEINLELPEKIYGEIIKRSYKILGYRKNNIKVPNKFLKPSKAKNIKLELKKILLWYNKNKRKIHPLALAILFHHKFEKIHPFTEENGEVGKIILNYMLFQANYPPMIIPRNLKKEYYQTMNKAYPCLKKDLLSTDMRYYQDLMNFMHKCFVKTYWDNFVV